MLNAEQQKAVNARQGRFLVIAAPGSGKTRVIVQRVLNLMAEKVPSTSILSVTFTREGADTMSDRAARYLLKLAHGEKIPQSRLDAAKKKYELEVSYGHKVFSTFHALALRFIKAVKRQGHFPELQDSIIATSAQVGFAMREALKNVGLSEQERKNVQTFISKVKRERSQQPKARADDEPTPSGMCEICGQTNCWTTFNYCKECVYWKAVSTYNKVLAEQRVFDFDDLILNMAQLLEKNEAVRNAWQCRYLQIDEAQDTDALQWSIAKLITERHKNLMAVGDENQGMYSFRGSESELEHNFSRRFPGAQVLILPENYRSSGAIVSYCKEIAPKQNETIINLRTANKFGTPVAYGAYNDEYEEAASTLGAVENPSKTAILVRMNSQLQPYEDGCTERKIPYHILGRGGFWRRHEIETLMAFVRCLVSPNDTALLKVIRSPYRIVRAKRDEKDEVIGWLSKQRVKSTELLDMLRRYPGTTWFSETFRSLPDNFARWRTQTASMRPGEAIHQLFAEIGAIEYYQEKSAEEDDPDNVKVENVSRLVSVASKTQSLVHFLEFAARVRRENKANPNALTLSTIHRSKGLEWDDVFVVGVNKGVLPHAKAETPGEEERIYFVACSRAAKRLEISCNGEPSPFIAARLGETKSTFVEDEKEEPDDLMSMFEMATRVY